MPVITSKQHVTSLTNANDSEIPPLSQKLITNEIDGRDYTFKIAVSDTQGYCVVNFDDTTICRVDFKVISEIPLLQGAVQIDSVFTDAKYRGIGLAPQAYLQLVKNFDVVSDTSQTEDGAKHWQVKMSTLENVNVHIIVNFPHNPAYITDNNGNLTIYKYGMDEKEELIWGLDVPDIRQKIEGINHRVDITNEDVVLVANYSENIRQ